MDEKSLKAYNNLIDLYSCNTFAPLYAPCKRRTLYVIQFAALNVRGETLPAFDAKPHRRQV